MWINAEVIFYQNSFTIFFTIQIYPEVQVCCILFSFRDQLTWYWVVWWVHRVKRMKWINLVSQWNMKCGLPWLIYGHSNGWVSLIPLVSNMVSSFSKWVNTLSVNIKFCGWMSPQGLQLLLANHIYIYSSHLSINFEHHLKKEVFGLCSLYLSLDTELNGWVRWLWRYLTASRGYKSCWWTLDRAGKKMDGWMDGVHAMWPFIQPTLIRSLLVSRANDVLSFISMYPAPYSPKGEAVSLFPLCCTSDIQL